MSLVLGVLYHFQAANRWKLIRLCTDSWNFVGVKRPVLFRKTDLRMCGSVPDTIVITICWPAFGKKLKHCINVQSDHAYRWAVIRNRLNHDSYNDESRIIADLTFIHTRHWYKRHLYVRHRYVINRYVGQRYSVPSFNGF